jgi:hypothetical protein
MIGAAALLLTPTALFVALVGMLRRCVSSRGTSREG